MKGLQALGQILNEIESFAYFSSESKKALPVTPLHLAAREGHVDCIELLLKHGAMVNAINEGKQTPLHECAFKGKEQAVKVLLIKGADPHAKNGMGRTPLVEACHQGTTFTI